MQALHDHHEFAQHTSQLKRLNTITTYHRKSVGNPQERGSWARAAIPASWYTPPSDTSDTSDFRHLHTGVGCILSATPNVQKTRSCKEVCHIMERDAVSYRSLSISQVEKESEQCKEQRRCKFPFFKSLPVPACENFHTLPALQVRIEAPVAFTKCALQYIGFLLILEHMNHIPIFQSNCVQCHYVSRIKKMNGSTPDHGPSEGENDLLNSST